MKTNQRITALALLAALFISSFASAQNEPLLKRKWNPQAKGTAIGAGVGGAAGAIIHKRDRKVGAGVGLAVGAAAGYGVGKVIDNRNKRAAAAARAAEEREYAARTVENRELRSGTSNRSSRSARARMASRSTTRTAGVAAGAAGAGYAASSLMQPETVEIPLVRNGYLLNTSYGDPNAAYPNSEYRRKSW